MSAESDKVVEVLSKRAWEIIDRTTLNGEIQSLSKYEKSVIQLGIAAGLTAAFEYHKELETSDEH